MSTNEIIRRRALRSSGASIDWESIARGMLDGVTQFEIPADVAVNPTINKLYGRTNATGVLTIPSGVTTIGNSAFYESGFTEIVLPASVTTIGTAFVAGSRYLEKINIEDTSLKVFNGGLASTTRLKSLTLPATLTSIQFNAFSQCSLEELILLGSTPPTIQYNQAFPGTWPIYVPDAAVEDYKAETSWANNTSRIKPISERPVGGG